MWEVLDVLKRHHRGESQRRIAVATGRGRKTIRAYIREAKKLGWSKEVPPDDELASRVAQRRQPGHGRRGVEPVLCRNSADHFERQSNATLIVGETYATFAELLPENSIIFLEVFDRILLGADPSGKSQREELP